MGMEIYRDTEKKHVLVWDKFGRELLKGWLFKGQNLAAFPFTCSGAKDLRKMGKNVYLISKVSISIKKNNIKQ